MNSLELVNKLYKPYRITRLSKCMIVESLDGKFVVKPKDNKDIKELYGYLKSRDFGYYPKLVDDSRSDINIFEYVSDTKYPVDQRANDMIKVVANLHQKTSYTKEVTEDKFKSIYDNIKNNIEYYKDMYTKYMYEFEGEEFMSPSHYLFIRNYSKLMSEIVFCSDKLDSWYDEVKNNKEIRVAFLHNNLSLDHFIKGDKEVLISWDKSIVDSPVLDIYNLYQKESLNVEFASVLSEYLKYYPLEKSELDLLFVMLSMPHEIKFLDDQLSSCQLLRKELDYVFKTESLVRPYYLKENQE